MGNLGIRIEQPGRVFVTVGEPPYVITHHFSLNALPEFGLLANHLEVSEKELTKLFEEEKARYNENNSFFKKFATTVRHLWHQLDYTPDEDY